MLILVAFHELYTGDFVRKLVQTQHLLILIHLCIFVLNLNAWSCLTLEVVEYFFALDDPSLQISTSLSSHGGVLCNDILDRIDIEVQTLF